MLTTRGEQRRKRYLWFTKLSCLSVLVLALTAGSAGLSPADAAGAGRLESTVAQAAATRPGPGADLGVVGGQHPGEERELALAHPPAGPILTHGVASGDVTSRSAVIWGRASAPAYMLVAYSENPRFERLRVARPVAVDQAGDYVGQIKLTGLRPSTRYYYYVRFVGSDSLHDLPFFQKGMTGGFTTAPRARESRPVSFIWAGDLAGQRYCRRVDQGFAIFSQMRALSPDFFVANGDMIYADGDCPEEGPNEPGGWQNIPGDFPNIASPSVDWSDAALVRDIFLKHWRYNRADPHFQQFLREVPMYAQWDDHEVINDFGAPWTYLNAGNIARPGYPNLVAAGREALFLYSPIDRHPAEPDRLYRSFSWGKDLELFLVDTRSYRSRNDLADTPENNKTMLGAEQLAWLKEGLARSKATWKVISAGVPMSIPTGFPTDNGRDGWANGMLPDFSSETGFERELRDLLCFLDAQEVKNVIFVTTDVHWATNIRYETDADGDGEAFVFHEFISAPLSAIKLSPTALDSTFGPTTLYAEGNLFSFGYARLQPEADGKVYFVVDIRGEDGQPRPGSEVRLAPQ